MWTWLRNKVRKTILAGVADAVQDLEASGDADPGHAVEFLRQRLGLAASVDGKRHALPDGRNGGNNGGGNSGGGNSGGGNSGGGNNGVAVSGSGRRGKKK